MNLIFNTKEILLRRKKPKFSIKTEGFSSFFFCCIPFMEEQVQENFWFLIVETDIAVHFVLLCIKFKKVNVD